MLSKNNPYNKNTDLAELIKYSTVYFENKVSALH